jgi:hypothetical protein
MNRTRWVFLLIVGAALIVVAIGLLLPLLRETGEETEKAPGDASRCNVDSVADRALGAAPPGNSAPAVPARAIRFVCHRYMDGLAAS